MSYFEKQNLINTQDEIINPATEETLQDILANQGNINSSTEEILQSITGNQYVSSNIDTEDATNYYFLSFIPGTTKWRINRLNKTSYVSDYAIGDSDIETAWTDRASQTYATIY